jgi:ATP-binding cassette subfamily C (CFTR/MRP) protein 1
VGPARPVAHGDVVEGRRAFPTRFPPFPALPPPPHSPPPSLPSQSDNPLNKSDNPPSKRRSPEFTSSWFSHIFFTWVNDLFRAGNVKGSSLKLTDILPLSDVDEPKAISATFERYIKENTEEKHLPNPVTAAVRSQFFAPMARAGAVKFVNSTLQFLPPILLNFFLQYLQEAQAGTARNAWEGYVWGCALFVAMSLRTLTENNYFHRVVRVGYQLRMAITTAVYRKALRLSPVARQEVPVGQIVNLMQQDASKLDGMCMQFHVIWDGLYQICGYMALLLYYIGPAALAGMLVMIILIPINIVMMVTMAKYRRAIVKHNDSRIKITNEALQGIRAIKLYNWETAFLARIAGIRDDELKAIREYALQGAVNTMLMQTAPILVAIVTLLVFAGSGGDFTAATVFTAISVLNSLRFPLQFYPMVIQQVAEAKVSFERLNKFILQPEVGAVAQLSSGGGAPGAAAADPAADPEEAAATAAATAGKNESTSSSSSSSSTPSSSSPDSVAVAVPPRSPSLDAVAPSVVTSTAARALALPEELAGIRLTDATFFWEDPASRKIRLKKKEDEERLAKEKAAKAKAKGGKGAKAKGAANTKSSPAGSAAGPVSSTPGPAATPAPDAAPAAPATPASELPVHPVLSGVSITVPAGQLWAVVGPVGAGKSALCAAILGELAKAKGDVRVRGRIAYVSQTAWVLNATLRRNVTFPGEAHGVDAGDGPEAVARREARYDRVLDACALRSDIAILPAGDMTEIGERGINLSGGQKQRVSIARAAYSGADVYLLDDPLSALDAEVGKAVFENCVCGILDGTTRLLITNALQYLQRCDGVIVLDSDKERGVGRVAYAGAFQELLDTVPHFSELMAAYGHNQGAGKGAKEGAAAAAGGAEGGDPVSPAAAAAAAAAAADAKATATAAKKAAAVTPATPTAAATAAGAAAVAGGKALMTVEEKNEGAVRGEYYWRYIRAGGNVPVIITVLFWAFALGQMAQLVSQWWITFWTADKNYVLHPEGFYMGIFVALGVAAAVLSFLRVVVMVITGIRASKSLHLSAITTVLSAPMAFFDTTPLGRIISRFTKDMESIDQQLPGQLGMLWMCIFFIFGTLGAIVFATPWFALVCIPVGIVYVRVMNYFRNVSRETKRFDAITRSPIFAHFSETLGGLSVIRAYGLQGEFAGQNEAKVSSNVAAWYTLKSCDRWLSIRLEVVGNSVVLAAALLAVGTALDSSRSEGTAAGLAGFSLSYAMAITGLLSWTVRTAAETEQMMNSVERLAHYTDTTPTEPFDCPRDRDTGKPVAPAAVPDGWPTAGALTFRDYRMSYREGTPEVLHGVSFDLRGGQKVGIVGRTGSGKSSLMVSLFRLIEDACHSGTIAVDGVDIDTVGLSTLRSALAIIPQDPILFSGTVKTNLDPVGAVRDDAKLWDALERVGLADAVRRLTGGLEAPVAEFGESLSVGQRQLMCLARVLLRKSRIILLDEATSSVDFATDQAMQRVIRESFSHCTILTIAHRLNTIIGSDSIVVMDAGKVAEIASPHELLSNPRSAFSALVDELGPQTAAALRAKAAEAAAAGAGAGGGEVA